MDKDTNNYYSVACEDLRYLFAGLHTGAYNNISALAQQVSEKMLKDSLLRVGAGSDSALKENDRQISY